VSSRSLDPAYARRVTKETREDVFFLMDAYIKSLHAMGKISWKKVPADVIYNIDDVEKWYH
jgi:hypothetical protein